ncbi:hypothetical protein Taro_053539 [Colocasia esculenta]|uniref:Pentatricopeptide repeat-containing protein n=1 Tax=Colocasia esculenta TaxID=4460 RepID=A0A843XNH9_COLES|nr:hypothetical protein [Colocasia esculenta]
MQQEEAAAGRQERPERKGHLGEGFLRQRSRRGGRQTPLSSGNFAMHDLGMEPSPHTFDGFVRAVISERGLTYAMRVVKEMEKRNLKPNNDTFSALVVGYSKNLDLDMAESFLDQISDHSPKYIHPFNAILAACDTVVSQII